MPHWVGAGRGMVTALYVERSQLIENQPVEMSDFDTLVYGQPQLSEPRRGLWP